VSGEPGVLVDRDGTLIRDVGYLTDIEQIELLPRAVEALKLFGRAGLKVAIVTNQSAVGRGLLDETGLEEIHRELQRRLTASGAQVDAIYYCPHHPTEAIGSYRLRCDCRKPDVGMARRAAEELGIDLGRSYVIGDKESDMELAAGVGAHGILLSATPPASAPYSVAKDIGEAAELILGRLGHAHGRSA
jgi:D-glycero-D-manno-heptose 1,7-bisphosphate phosphatase